LKNVLLLENDMMGIFRGSLFEALHFYYRIRTTFLLNRRISAAVERHRAQYYKNLWIDAARHVGADIRCLGGEFFEIHKSDRVVRVWRAETTLSNLYDHKLTGNKPLIAEILSDLNAPIPRYCVFDLITLSRALDFFQEIGGPVVVKPSDGTGGGNSVVTNITSRSGIVKAAANARATGRRMLIEEQVSGDNYRLLYLDGDLIDCVLRKPATLTGDGSSNLAQLVTTENETRLATGTTLAQVQLSVDMDLRNTLASQGLTLSSVPAAGRKVVMKDVINQNRREDNQPATELLCEPIADLGRKILRAVGSRVVGVDVITNDLSIPLEESGGVILEVNSPPGLYFHNRQTEDGAYEIAVAILRNGLS